MGRSQVLRYGRMYNHGRNWSRDQSICCISCQNVLLYIRSQEIFDLSQFLSCLLNFVHNVGFMLYTQICCVVLL